MNRTAGQIYLPERGRQDAQLLADAVYMLTMVLTRFCAFAKPATDDGDPEPFSPPSGISPVRS